MKRIWIVSELFHPEETSTGHVMTAIAEALTGPQASVEVLCAQPSYSKSETTSPRVETWHDMHIRRVLSPRLDNSGMPGRLTNLVGVTVSMFVTALRHVRKGDTMLCVTNPPTLPYAITLAARLRGAQMILLVHDVFPDILLEGETPAKPSFAFRIARRASAVLLRSSTAIIAIGRDQQRLLQSRNSGNAPVHMIRIAADMDSISHAVDRADSFLIDRIEVPADALEQSATVFQFAGNIGPLQNVEGIADGIVEFQRLEESNAARFVFIGTGRRRAVIEDGIADGRLRNTWLHGWIPREEASHLHAACDVSIIALRQGMLGVSVPSRIGNVLASGRAVIAVCEVGSELDLLVSEEGIGWSVRPTDTAGLVSAFAAAVTDRDEIRRMGQRSRELALREFTPDHMAAAYRRLLIQSDH